MSKVFERIIEENQIEIDGLRAIVESDRKQLAIMWTKHNELFEAMARLLDSNSIHQIIDADGQESFFKLHHEVRMQMMDAGYCLQCYNFMCECDYD